MIKCFNNTIGPTSSVTYYNDGIFKRYINDQTKATMILTLTLNILTSSSKMHYDTNFVFGIQSLIYDNVFSSKDTSNQSNENLEDNYIALFEGI